MPGGYTNWSYEKAKSIPYLDEIINETLRLQPALMTGGARETPAKGLQIDSTYIPGNINVVMPVYLIQRDPRWWQQGEEFVPERFGELRKEMGTDEAPYLPFSLGRLQTSISRLPEADFCFCRCIQLPWQKSGHDESANLAFDDSTEFSCRVCTWGDWGEV